MPVLYKDMRHAENNKYYVSLMVFYNKKGNNNVDSLIYDPIKEPDFLKHFSGFTI